MQNKKRAADGIATPPAPKRRKASMLSVASGAGTAHPLRQTSFPPDEFQAATPFQLSARSPSVDTASLVSGSLASGAPRARRKRRTKAEIAAQAALEVGKSPSASVVGGRRTGTVVSGISAGAGRKRGGTEEQGEDEEDDSGPVIQKKNEEQRAQDRIKEQKMRALLTRAMNETQLHRFSILRITKLADATVKRVSVASYALPRSSCFANLELFKLVNATVSQSVPPNFVLGVRTVAKEFAGDLIEEARRVQGEWAAKGVEAGAIDPPPKSIANAMGPLRPEHLIEAWRRYKMGATGGVGIQGLWHEQQDDGVGRFMRSKGKRLLM
jgi:transcription initiation factor TFIID subunit 11